MATHPVEREAPWSAFSDLVTLRTQSPRQFIDLTELVAERVRQSGIDHGLVSVVTRHTTTAIVVNEDEPLLLDDMAHLLDRLVPPDIRYGHDDMERRRQQEPTRSAIHSRVAAEGGEGETRRSVSPLPEDERANGAAHCRSLLLGGSQVLHVIHGALQLGCWQRVFLVELDGPRTRSVSILVLGLRGRHV